MDEEVRKLVSRRIEEFRAQLEVLIREKVGPEQAVNLHVNFELSFRPMFQIATFLSANSTMEVSGVDVDQVPNYHWKRSEVVETTDEPVSLAAIASAIQRRHREKHFCNVIKAFAQNGNAPLTFEEMKKLGVPDTFYHMVRQDLRYCGVPFTIVQGKERGLSYKLKSIKPPRSFKK